MRKLIAAVSLLAGGHSPSPWLWCVGIGADTIYRSPAAG
jgi:hypothetical protein